jgi:hypothetical protein
MSTLIQSSPTAGKAIAQIEAAMTVRRIFGEPIENHGVTVLPVPASLPGPAAERAMARVVAGVADSGCYRNHWACL